MNVYRLYSTNTHHIKKPDHYNISKNLRKNAKNSSIYEWIDPNTSKSISKLISGTKFSSRDHAFFSARKWSPTPSNANLYRPVRLPRLSFVDWGCCITRLRHARNRRKSRNASNSTEPVKFLCPTSPTHFFMIHGWMHRATKKVAKENAAEYQSGLM